MEVRRIDPAQVRVAVEGLDGLVQHIYATSFTKNSQHYLIEKLAQIRNSVDAAVATIALQIERSDAHVDVYATSAPAYVADVLGENVATAHAVLDCARGLEDHPDIRYAFASGVLSASKTQSLVAGLAVADEVRAERLKKVAFTDTLSALQKDVRSTVAAAKKPKDLAAAKAKEYFKATPDDAFGMRLSGYLTNESWAQLNAAMKPEFTKAFSHAWKTESFVSREHTQAQALVALSKRKHDGKTSRPHVLIGVSLDALLRGYPIGNEVSEILGVGPTTVDRIRQMLDDAHVRIVVQGENLKSAGRMMTSAMVAQAMFDQHRCGVNGCDNDLGDWDHNHEWRDGGKTEQHNMHRLCGTHHGYKTRYRLKLVGPFGQMKLVPLNPDEMGGGSRGP